MLRRFLLRLDAFEDDPIAAVIGIMVLIALTYAMLLVPTPVVVSQ
jgi:hypothetical protein